jgi:hypothetical protein
MLLGKSKFSRAIRFSAHINASSSCEYVYSTDPRLAIALPNLDWCPRVPKFLLNKGMKEMVIQDPY